MSEDVESIHKKRQTKTFKERNKEELKGRERAILKVKVKSGKAKHKAKRAGKGREPRKNQEESKKRTNLKLRNRSSPKSQETMKHSR